MPNMKSNIIVHNALISGDNPNFNIEKILIGKVVLSEPDTKKFIITSSKDNANASIAPESIPGNVSGKIIVVNTLNLLAPRSIAASSIELSNPENLALTTISTNGMQKVACDKTKVVMPKGTLSCAKYIKSDIPIIISGITITILRSVSIIPLPLNLYLYSPIAPNVPTIEEIIVLAVAIIRLFLKAIITLLSSNNFLYQSKVKPVHIAFVLDALKE
jgi:hypothetical protein